MDDEIVGWLTSPRSSVYHPDQAHADALVGDGGLHPVTLDEAEKFGLHPCSRCSAPKPRETPDNVAATSRALRSMFVLDGTEAEIVQMAEDFLHDLGEEGFTVRRIPRRRNTAEPPTLETASEVPAPEVQADPLAISLPFDSVEVGYAQQEEDTA